MGLQNQNGKSFEYAVALALSEVSGGQIISNSAFNEAEQNYLRTAKDLQERQTFAARGAVQHLRKLGEFAFPELDEIQIRLSSGASEQRGDVRDVIISDESKSIGISCKNNHWAFKHSRLSSSIDFVKKWGLDSRGASNEYWKTVSPIFQDLRSIRNSSLGKAKWEDLDGKQDLVYSPILNAFENEMKRVFGQESEKGPNVTNNFIDYIVGKFDFYRFIVSTHHVEIVGFNFHNTLQIPVSKYPTKIISVERDSTHPTTSILKFKEGHTFSFRIHNASSTIEPSLKFDIQALVWPVSQLYSHELYI